MEIIVKGKNIKLNYKFCIVDYWHLIRVSYDPYEVRQIKRKIDMLRCGDIISNEEVTYETYFESNNIDYRLNIGEKFNGNMVELVEGTDDGNIIYYTDKVLKLDDNVEEKNKIEKDIDNQIEELQQELERTELRIQTEELRNRDKILKTKTKTKTKKWYKFWQ